MAKCDDDNYLGVKKILLGSDVIAYNEVILGFPLEEETQAQHTPPPGRDSLYAGCNVKGVTSVLSLRRRMEVATGGAWSCLAQPLVECPGRCLSGSGYPAPGYGCIHAVGEGL